VKKTGLLNQSLSTTIAGMGHTDMLVVSDAGLPIPLETMRIDLAVTRGIPSFLDVVKAILGEMAVESAIIASEMTEHSPEMHTALLELLGDIPVEEISHDEFKARTHNAYAVARTGEFTPYANVILRAGVVF
jgi:D-ribose pyranase